MSSEKAAEQSVVLVVVRGRRASEWRLQRCLAGILFPVVHLFQKLFCLLLVDEG
jgi:hypothetical protein